MILLNPRMCLTQSGVEYGAAPPLVSKVFLVPTRRRSVRGVGCSRRITSMAHWRSVDAPGFDAMESRGREHSTQLSKLLGKSSFHSDAIGAATGDGKRGAVMDCLGSPCKADQFRIVRSVAEIIVGTDGRANRDG